MFNPIHHFIFILLDISARNNHHFLRVVVIPFSLNQESLSLVFFLFTTYSQYIFVAPDKVRQAKKTVFKAIVI